jgi:hypothetical protein
MPPPEPRSSTVSPGLSSASAVGLPQPREVPWYLGCLPREPLVVSFTGLSPSMVDLSRFRVSRSEPGVASLAGFHYLSEVDVAELGGDFTAGTEAPACRRLILCAVVRLAFATALGRSLSGRDSTTPPLQRHTGSRGPNRGQRSEDRYPLVGLLSWGSSIRPFSDILSLRPLPSGPSPELWSGTATSQTRSALAVPPGFSGLLRKGPRSEDRGLRQRAGLLHPAAARGVHHVSNSCAVSRLPVNRRRFTFEAFPCGEYPSKLSPLR